MDSLSSKKQVSQYLVLLRRYVGNWLRICHRKASPDKNYDFMRKNGLSTHDVKQVIKDLEVRDYSIGPCRDDLDLPGRNDVWKFGKCVSFNEDAFELYIKIAVGEKEGSLGCVCISFHPCEHAINYPYKEEVTR